MVDRVNLPHKKTQSYFLKMSLLWNVLQFPMLFHQKQLRKTHSHNVSKMVKMFSFFSSPAPLSAGGAPCCWGCGMSLFGRKALTLLSSVFAVCALGLLGIAVSTDYWLYLEEGVILPLNQSTEVRMSLHSGLWRVCFLVGELERSLKLTYRLKVPFYAKSICSCLLYINMCPLCVERFWKFQEERFSLFLSWSI